MFREYKKEKDFDTNRIPYCAFDWRFYNASALHLDAQYIAERFKRSICPSAEVAWQSAGMGKLSEDIFPV